MAGVENTKYQICKEKEKKHGFLTNCGIKNYPENDGFDNNGVSDLIVEREKRQVLDNQLRRT